jgi:glucose/arabinose dehydrogenase
VPWAIGFLPDGNWLVTERPGRVRLIRGGRELGETVISFASSRGEGGLLGLALHPQFGANRLFYLYRTAEDGTNQVERYRLGADDTSATLDRLVVGGIRGARFHDGGRIRFGPDGMLYVGTGDGTEPDRAQDRSSLNGKLLRLTPDGEVPSDNPFPGSPVFLLGIRNLEAFDWLEGRTLVLAEHGPSGELGRSGHDEVNVARGGDNLGWPTIYGCQRAAGMVSPALTWQKAVPPGGGALYTGTAIPEWRGSFLVGTLGSKHLHRVELAPGDPGRVARHEVYFQGDPPTGFGRLREVVMGPDGELYVTTSNCDGRGSCPPDKDRILRVFR